jgi:hypothetical protein
LRKGVEQTHYSLRDLDVLPETLDLSVSHVAFFQSVTAERMGHWTWPVNELAKYVNPCFDKSNHTFTLVGSDNRERVFNYTTGKLIRIETQAAADARKKAILETLQLKADQSPTNAPLFP